MPKKFECIVVDTLTGIQQSMYTEMSKKPDYDKWTDWGKHIFNFCTGLNKLGFQLVFVLGRPGTGKSYGMKFLDPETTIWYNGDNKNPTWKGGKEQFGSKVNRTPNHIIPETFADIEKDIMSRKASNFAEERVAFILGHIEDYKTKDGIMNQRLKLLGNLATKMDIEGRSENTLYANVEILNGKPDYYFSTEPDGYNTVRTQEQLFDEPRIKNNYREILDKIKSY